MAGPHASAHSVFANARARDLRGAPPVLSAIIPTFRRPQTLLRVLDALARQENVNARDYEAVVSDDGSGDGTVAAVRAWAESAALRLLLAAAPANGGPARARNRALALAGGRIIWFTGDDIIPARDLVARHLRWHVAHPADEDALLGRVAWPEQPAPSPFMRWLAGPGSAFYFAYPEAPGRVAPDRFYTCNVSLKRVLLDRGGAFDEAFAHASHEDLELGLRLARRAGMRLHFDPQAIAWHEHALALPAACRRVYVMGYCSEQFWRKAPGAAPRRRRILGPLLWRAAAPEVVRRGVSRVAARAARRMSAPILWRLCLAEAYWQGVADERRSRPLSPVKDRAMGGDT
jgi:glycosyltransferase involved in cell wall biosynthesis